MRNRLMRRFALVADKSLEFPTDCTKTKLLFLATIGTRRITRSTGEFADAFFGRGGHVCLVYKLEF